MRKIMRAKYNTGRLFGNLWRGSGCLLVLLSLLFQPQEGWSDSQKAMALEQMTDFADEIVVGKVISNESRWQGRLIITVSTIEVLESIKGQPGPTVEITQLGGTAVHPRINAPVHMSASGSAVLSPGEEVLLFVRKARGDVRDLIGGPQGKLVIDVDQVTGDQILPVAPKVVKGLDQNGKRMITPRQMTLDEIRQRIKKQMQAVSKTGKSGESAP